LALKLHIWSLNVFQFAGICFNIIFNIIFNEYDTEAKTQMTLFKEKNIVLMPIELEQ
jgi:hypothetical protein